MININDEILGEVFSSLIVFISFRVEVFDEVLFSFGFGFFDILNWFCGSSGLFFKFYVESMYKGFFYYM